MDKPINLSVKDYIIRKMAVKMMVPEKTIEAVVNHQFQSASEAMKKNRSVELSGFGKFYFNYNKALKKLALMEAQRKGLLKHLSDPEVPQKKKDISAMKIEGLTEAIHLLKPMLDNEPVTDLRGMEEQVDSPLPFEGTDK